MQCSDSKCGGATRTKGYCDKKLASGYQRNCPQDGCGESLAALSNVMITCAELRKVSTANALGRQQS